MVALSESVKNIRQNRPLGRNHDEVMSGWQSHLVISEAMWFIVPPDTKVLDKLGARFF